MIIIKDRSRAVVLEAIQANEATVATDDDARKQVAIDHYKHNVADLENDVAEWFKSKIFKVVPVFIQKVVPRFASAKINIIYKRPPKRKIRESEADNKKNISPNTDFYKNHTYKLDVKQKTHAEMTWLLGRCALYSYWNDFKKRIEYKTIGIFNKYYLENDEDNVWGISYEIQEKADGTRRFMFWSEERDGIPGDHYIMDARGDVQDDENNKEHINPYGILPFTIAEYETNALDVVAAAIQINIAMTQLAIGGRNNLGLLWTDAELSDEDNEDDGEKADKEINWDSLNILQVAEGRQVDSVNRGGDLKDNIEIIKAFYSTTAENNNLTVNFEQRGSRVYSGAALRIMEIENNDTLESILPFWRVVESERYAVDRVIIKKEAGKDLSEEINTNFASIDSGLTELEKQKLWDWKFKHGGTIRDYYLETDPDMAEVDLNKRIEAAEEILELELVIAAEEKAAIIESRKTRTAKSKLEIEELK